MPVELLFDRERAVFVRLRQAIRDRKVRESSLIETYAVDSAVAEREGKQAREEVRSARIRTLDELDRAHEKTVAAIATRYDTAQKEADNKRASERKKVVDHYSSGLEKARSEFQDKLWTVDSVHEAEERQLLDHHEETKRKVAASIKRSDSVWETMAPLLAEAKIERSEVEFDPELLPPPTETDPYGKVEKCLEEADAACDRFLNAPLRKFVGLGPTVGFALLFGALGAGVGFATLTMVPTIALGVGLAVVGAGVLSVVLKGMYRKQLLSRGGAVGVFQAETTRAIVILDSHAEQEYKSRIAAAVSKRDNGKRRTTEFFEPRIAEAEKRLEETLNKIDAEHISKSKSLQQGRVSDLKTQNELYEKVVAQADKKFQDQAADVEAKIRTRGEGIVTARDSGWELLVSDWFAELGAIQEELVALRDFGMERFPSWEALDRDDRTWPKDAPFGIRYGETHVALESLPDGIPHDARLVPAEPFAFDLPTYIPFPDRCAVLVKAADTARDQAAHLLQAMALRFLTGLPAGKVRFTIVDPVGLGENFASLMHLADYDEKTVTSRIWTEPGHIERRLADLTEHMETVIQKYLRNRYASIEDYNREAGEVAEPYRVLIVANFPTNFTSDAARRLVSIMTSGPSCGVCALVGYDTKTALPRDFRIADLEQVAFRLQWNGAAFLPADEELAAFPPVVDVPPDAEQIASIVRRAGKAGLDAARVEVPFSYIAPADEAIWTSSSAKNFEIPIGRAGATRRQNFILGKGTAQHALIAGKTGSGKSTLIHAVITNLALMYSPDEAELYMIDFKKGVEFRAYAKNKLPHARVVAIESEREFGLSVLQRLDGILRERGDAFRDAGVNDLASYRAAKPGVRSPRILFIVDEFQEFFVEDDKLAQEAALLLDRIVRQGRAFGVHVVLGSQTLGGAYSLARSTIDQMAVRIALQCSEADAQLILSKDNTAARLLNRPGDAIYNDANGLVEGNDPFQVVWLSDEERENRLHYLRDRAEGLGLPDPLVFEGNSAADPSKNVKLRELVQREEAPTTPPVVWLGEAIAIKEPTSVLFRAQSAANLLILGQDEEGALGLAATAMASLVARLRPKGTARALTIIDGTPDDAEHADFLRSVAKSLQLTDAIIERPEMGTALAELSAELDRRTRGESDRIPRFLFVHGIQRLRELRKAEEDFGFGRKADKAASPGELFANLVREGPTQGIHLIVWCDSLTNFQRAFDRQGLKEFLMRVIFQVSATDSSNLIDSPAASRLGRNRALYVEEGAERPEKFRPYGMPDPEWLKALAEAVG